MFIKIFKDGTIKWYFHRKAYKKARWRKLGQRLINYFQKTPGAYGLISRGDLYKYSAADI